jgi:hypothetical protein
MTDSASPTTQFHPYQAPEATPVAERPTNAIGRNLTRVGVDPAKMRSAAERGRAYARRHPGRILGGMALAVIGAGLLRGRMVRGPKPAVNPS